LAVVDLESRVPVRVVADDDVGSPVDRVVADRHRVVRRGHPAVGHRLALVLLAPVELDDDDVGELPRTLDPRLERGLVDRPTDPVEADEPELDPTYVDHG